jgi:hypothetical protein
MSKYLNFLKNSLLDVIDKVETDDITNGMIIPSKALTMIGRKRLDNIQMCVEDVIKNKIEGDLIETGVWRGGAVIFMKAIIKEYGEQRKVFVADSFSGIPAPNAEKYPLDSTSMLHIHESLKVSAEQVRNNFRKYNLLDDDVVFIEGLFKDKLPTAPIDKLSVLRLDGDLYESTMDSLVNLYPKLQSGGYCIIDDYGFAPCQQAVNDYRNHERISDKVFIIDTWGAYWRKQ